MNRSGFGGLVERLRLGHLQGSPRIVRGGLVHRVWRVRTDRASFAIKVLDPRIISKRGLKTAYRWTEGVAARVRTSGIRTPVAITHRGELLHQVGGRTCIVHEWIEGRCLACTEVRGVHARRMGEVLAGIHLADIPRAGVRAESSRPMRSVRWDVLGERLGHGLDNLARALQRLGPTLDAWGASIDRVNAGRVGNRCVSHRDLDPKNVIWAGSEPVIVDWESAGFTRPDVELVRVALDWTGIDRLKSRVNVLDAVFTGYRRAGGKAVVEPERALLGAVEPYMNWLAFNLERCHRSSAGLRLLGRRESAGTLRRLKGIQDHWEWLIAALR